MSGLLTGNPKLRECRVVFYDRSDLVVQLNVDKCYGVNLMDNVCNYIDLGEKDYFGLQFVHPKDDKLSWLDNRKIIKSQVKDGMYVFYFRIKFFPPDPMRMCEDLSRYFLLLQIKADLASGRLTTDIYTLVLLASYVAQAENGDYEPEMNIEMYSKLGSFGTNQPADFYDRVQYEHPNHSGLTAAEADCGFLNIAKNLQHYGSDFYSVTDCEKLPRLVGVFYGGVNVCLQTKEIIQTISWEKLLKVLFQRKAIVFRIDLGESRSNLKFYCDSRTELKRFYRSVIDHHTFFRRLLPPPPITGLQLNSKFRYSGRKTYQQFQMGFGRNSTLNRVNNNRFPTIRPISAESPESSRSLKSCQFSTDVSIENTGEIVEKTHHRQVVIKWVQINFDEVNGFLPESVHCFNEVVED